MLILYRLAPSDSKNRASRPAFFSKQLCLESLLGARSALASDSELLLLVDADSLSAFPFDPVAAIGDCQVRLLGGIGNSASMRVALSIAGAQPPDSFVYFVEDDYLHTLDSLTALQSAACHFARTTYLTLYDHPIRYATDYKFGLDLPTLSPRIELVENRHWRTQESTCMTFGGTAATVQEDMAIFERYLSTDVPADRELFRRLQGLVSYEDGSPCRELFGPVPSLATHCHDPWLAPAVDWQMIAESISKDRRAR